MRTVSFSSDKVKSLLNDKFHCATINTDGDPTAGSSSAHAPTDSCGRCARGIGKQNVQCLFLTPKAEIFHVASGFIGPKDLARELSYALKLYDGIRKKPESAKKLVALSHRNRLKEFGFNATDIRRPRSRSSAQDMLRNMFGSRRGGGFNFRMSPAQMQRLARQTRNSRRNVGGSFLGRDGDNFHQSHNNGIFAFKSKGTVLNDHKFCMEHPMLSYSEFEDRPQILVGNEKTAFSSTGGSSPSGGKIGN